MKSAPVQRQFQNLSAMSPSGLPSTAVSEGLPRVFAPAIMYQKFKPFESSQVVPPPPRVPMFSSFRIQQQPSRPANAVAERLHLPPRLLSQSVALPPSMRPRRVKSFAAQHTSPATSFCPRPPHA